MLSREFFEKAIVPIVDRTMIPVKMALADAHLTPSEIDEVVLVGGTTRTPLIRTTVQEYSAASRNRAEPDEVVALGAAVQATSSKAA